MKRHPELVASYRRFDVDLAFAAKLGAYSALFPDRVDDIKAVRLRLEHRNRRDMLSPEAQAEANLAFGKLVAALVEAEGEEMTAET